MKKLICGVLTMLAVGLSFSASAQQQIPMAPIDSMVRVGKLDNGLTYIIRHNEKPKGQADFFIAQKVGSILEEEHQRGLAHFLEHMCFNGTKNFPGNSLIDWLGTVGVKFGQNLNAYTSIDETVYNISSVPVSRTGVQDSCLLILHDWADGLLLDPEEIEKERGVIHQEWRASNVGMMRLYEQLLPVIYPGNKYGVRLPIGTMEVVDNFPPSAIREYYESWYRPDQQGIIVVGDIDVDYIEGKIKEIFADVKMPENAKEREYLQVEDTPGTIYAIGKDKEQPMALALLMFKQKEQLLPREYRSTMAYFPVQYIKSMITEMLQNRFNELAQKPDAAFANPGAELGDFFISKTKDALTLQIAGKGNDIRPAIESAYRELLRAARGGFTVSEYDRVKSEYLANLEKSYEQRDGRDNTSYCREYVRFFVDGDPIPGIGTELELAKQYTAMFTVEAINQAMNELVGEENRVLAVFLPDKEGYYIPTEDELAKIMNGVDGETIEPYKEELKNEPLIPGELNAVQAKSATNAQWDATELTYPNGAHVIFKPTKFKNGEIVFEAIAKGGLSAVDSDPATLQTMSLMMTAWGLGTYNHSDMEKYLVGKQTSFDMSIDDYYRSLEGSTTPKNITTLMELIHMAFVDWQITADDFSATQSKFITLLENQEKTPDFVFQRDMIKSLYKAAAKQLFSTEALRNANRDELISLVHNMYANPADFTFVFVGDIDPATFVPLCDKYIGSLNAPRIAGVPYVQNPDFEMTTGAATNQDKMAMETPKTTAVVSLSANIPYTAKNRAIASMAAQILTKRLLNRIREEMGAVYSIGAQGGLTRLENQNASIMIPFPMKPEAKDQVLAEIDTMLHKMAEEVKADELAPVTEFMIKQAADNAEQNSQWTNAITATMLNNVDTFNGQADVINSVTTADIQNYIKELLNQNNYRVYLLEPAE